MHAEYTQLAQVRGQFTDRHLTGFEPFRDVRPQPLFAEAADSLTELFVLGRQLSVEVEQVIDAGGSTHGPVLHPGRSRRGEGEVVDYGISPYMGG